MKDYKPTPASKVWTLIYIDNKLKYKTSNVLKLYKERKIECNFLEIIEPHKKDKITGCIYKHPNVPVTEFTNDYMGQPLNLYRVQKKVEDWFQYKYSKLWLRTADFVDTNYASSSYPNVNISTRITAISKTLIDNIFYNDFTKKHGWKHSYFYLWSFNSVFDNYRPQNKSSFEDNRK